MHNLLLYSNDIFIPVAASIVFFILAKFVRYIGPLRQFSSGKETYVRAFNAYLTFGLYLITRPLQVLLGPHPMPLIINTIREFILIAFACPSMCIAVFGLTYGGESIKREMKIPLFGASILLAAAFCIISISTAGGSTELYTIGSYTVYDVLWSSGDTSLTSWLFNIRLINPVLIFAGFATLALIRALRYPVERRKIYSNMPKKLLLNAAGLYCFAISMLMLSLAWRGAPSCPCRTYYLGTLLAGLLEAWSVSLPMRRER